MESELVFDVVNLFKLFISILSHKIRALYNPLIPSVSKTESSHHRECSSLPHSNVAT